MDDSKKENIFGHSRAFVPAWQLQDSPDESCRGAGNRPAIAEAARSPPAAARAPLADIRPPAAVAAASRTVSKAPPVPPRGGSPNHSAPRAFQPPYSPHQSHPLLGNLSSPFSAYSSPFLGSFAAPSAFRPSPGAPWNPAAASAVPRLGAHDPLSGEGWSPDSDCCSCLS